MGAESEMVGGGGHAQRWRCTERNGEAVQNLEGTLRNQGALRKTIGAVRDGEALLEIEWH